MMCNTEHTQIRLLTSANDRFNTNSHTELLFQIPQFRVNDKYLGTINKTLSAKKCSFEEISFLEYWHAQTIFSDFIFANLNRKYQQKNAFWCHKRFR